MTPTLKGEVVPLTQKTVLSIAEACRLAGCGRSTIYAAIGEGVLVARKNRMRTIILRADLDAWINAWPTTRGRRVVGVGGG